MKPESTSNQAFRRSSAGNRERKGYLVDVCGRNLLVAPDPDRQAGVVSQELHSVARALEKEGVVVRPLGF